MAIMALDKQLATKTTMLSVKDVAQAANVSEKTVLRWLEQCLQPWLLIYDNAIDAESLRPYLPPAGAARVLVTSNARVWRGIAAPVGWHGPVRSRDHAEGAARGSRRLVSRAGVRPGRRVRRAG